MALDNASPQPPIPLTAEAAHVAFDTASHPPQLSIPPPPPHAPSSDVSRPPRKRKWWRRRTEKHVSVSTRKLKRVSVSTRKRKHVSVSTRKQKRVSVSTSALKRSYVSTGALNRVSISTSALKRSCQAAGKIRRHASPRQRVTFILPPQHVDKDSSLWRRVHPDKRTTYRSDPLPVQLAAPIVALQPGQPHPSQGILATSATRAACSVY